MVSVRFNGVPEPAVHAVTWGDVLATIQSACAGRQEMIVGLRLDGADRTDLLESADRGQPVPDGAVVDVETATPSALVKAALDDASLALDSLARAADRLGLAFRGTDLAAANRDLAEFASGLRALLVVTGAVAGASGIDLARLGGAEHCASDLVRDLNQQAEVLVDAQGAGDWITVADTIEFDVAGTLRQWPALLSALRPAPQPSAVR